MTNGWTVCSDRIMDMDMGGRREGGGRATEYRETKKRHNGSTNGAM